MSSEFWAGDHPGDGLSAFIDGELLPPQEAGVRAHLVACAPCAQELVAVSQARTWVRALPPVDPPFGLYERLLLDRSPVFATSVFAGPVFASRSTLRRRAGIAAFGAAAAAVTVLGMGSPVPPPANPAAPRVVQARATTVSAGADLLSKLAPMGVPVSFGR